MLGAGSRPVGAPRLEARARCYFGAAARGAWAGLFITSGAPAGAAPGARLPRAAAAAPRLCPPPPRPQPRHGEAEGLQRWLYCTGGLGAPPLLPQPHARVAVSRSSAWGPARPQGRGSRLVPGTPGSPPASGRSRSRALRACCCLSVPRPARTAPGAPRWPPRGWGARP